MVRKRVEEMSSRRAELIAVIKIRNQSLQSLRVEDGATAMLADECLKRNLMTLNKATAKSIAVALSLVAFSVVCLGQELPSTMLLVEFENNVQYNQDTVEISKLATDPGITTVAASKNFQSNVVIADIVAVNGQPAKGVFFRERRTIMLTPNPTSGQAIADVTRNFSGFATAFEILQPDGTPIGSIFLSGFGGGSPTLRAHRWFRTSATWRSSAAPAHFLAREGKEARRPFPGIPALARRP